jgi:hypothetical protein
MNDVHWWLVGLSFVMGLVLTFGFSVRPIKRRVPVGAPANQSGSEADTKSEPPVAMIPPADEFFTTSIPTETESPTTVIAVEQEPPTAPIPPADEFLTTGIPTDAESPTAVFPVQQEPPTTPPED